MSGEIYSQFDKVQQPMLVSFLYELKRNYQLPEVFRTMTRYCYELS